MASWLKSCFCYLELRRPFLLKFQNINYADSYHLLMLSLRYDFGNIIDTYMFPHNTDNSS